MRLHLAIGSVPLLLATSLVQANTYQYEGNISADLYDGYVTDDIYLVSATYYIKPVDTTNKPLAEAAFLNRAASVSLNYKDNYYGSDNIYGNQKERYRDHYRAHGVSAQSWFFEGYFYVAADTRWGSGHSHWNTTDLDTLAVIKSGHANYNIGNSWNLTLGSSPVAGLLITTDLYEGEFNKDAWNIATKYVTDIAGNNVNFELEYEEVYDYSITTLAGDYYFTPAFSIGATVAIEDLYSSNTRYGVRSQYFITQYLGVFGEYTDYDEGDGYIIGVTGRF